MKKIVIAILFLSLSGIAGALFAEGVMETEAPETSLLPVTEVTLYTAGLAQIVHETVVKENEILRFPVEPRDIDDILKSLTVEDLDGGTVDVINFDSGNPLSVILGDLRLNPSGSPGLASFLAGAQGEEVSLSAGEGQFEGRIFSVEQQKSGDERKTVLNLIDGTGIKAVDITSLKNLQFTDPALQHELLGALEKIAGARVSAVRTLRLSFKGSGLRRVRISYIKAVPLWKTSYRLILDEEGTPRLEGWALVQNTGSTTWKDVKMRFVAGQPNAFVMDLSTPRWVTRQRVETAAAAPIGATAYEKAYPSAAPEASRSRSAAPMMEMADSYGFAEAEESYAPPALAPQAAGVRAGNFYQYEVKLPVTVEPRSSAMIPILTFEDAGRPMGIYDPAYNLVFKGVRLENDTDAQWPAGPVTVNEGRRYGGDALVPEMIPGSTRLITYAVHGTLDVQMSTERQPQRITGLKMADGILYRTDKITRTTVYHVEGDEKELLIIHPRSGGWSLTRSPEVHEQTDDEYRFLISSWAEPVPVEEEYIVSQQFSLNSFRAADTAVYLEWNDISPAMKRAFERIAQLRREAERVRSEMNVANSNITRIERDQSRVRENMKVLDKESELFIQYSRQLAAQEDEIISLNNRIKALQSELQSAEKALNDYVMGLKI